ncbi:HTH domain-containing protein [Bradyrhizobium sp. 170]|nr:HTH domain-containing protein [Bradyrhizobium sp. 170]
MSRAQRLLDLIQLLRGYRRPVSGAVLAEALGISLRTLYRDIETLNAQGAQIDGEPGVGYAARSALAKISAVLPPDLKDGLDTSGLLIGPGQAIATCDAELPLISTLAPARYWASLSSAMVVLAAASSSGKKSIGPGLS